MNTYEALDRLKQAGITDSIQTLRRWLRDGTIKAQRSENRKAGFEVDAEDLKRFINERTGADKDERIRQLEEEIRRLKEKNERLKADDIDLDEEEDDLLTRMNIDFIKQLKQQQQMLLYKQQKQNDARYRLGLTETSTDDEVLQEFKKLLKILHPDSGGNAKLFNDIKQQYNEFRRYIQS
ncbi:hypothetical protein P4S93_13945 [Aneurinibacillus thermoaerophilus]|uniref:hypothetical protein n=1 Tax=Aneurinibacillus thermoaerophilus TaxID=143495 RepID=UPI002E21603F|nr:hypothetical protein [Aneurinibacillus thermoaerophilus]MED0761862.1 hypothetical protein [Aneurinibacillus thermoaerophilus]